MKKQIGFTLIELMVTIIIMGIMAAISLPAMNGFMERQRIKSALNGYANALTFARNEAIRQNVPVIACGASISTTGQLAGCANNTKSWSEGVFVYADVNRNSAYNSTVDRNIRVFNSPNAGSGVADANKLDIAVKLSPLTGTSAVTNPNIQFLPNSQVVINDVASANYVVIDMQSKNNTQHTGRVLLGPTGKIISCSQQVKSNNTGNKIAELCG
ncbi:GspH/FimT family pseudopilin [Vitreoscilla stercoraria]|nr:GspH/FimT family pseudopilin [Vitreoscilla stercoraria]